MNDNGQQGASPWGEHADLDRWGAEAVPQHAIRAKLETVPDGDYDCEVIDANLENIQGKKVVKLGLRLINAGGRVIEHSYWFDAQPKVNGFLADMAALGFPAHIWGQGPGKTVALSIAIPECLKKLPGIRFRATKTHDNAEAKPAFAGRSAQEARTFHKLHIGGRITGAPMPAISGPAAQTAAPAPQQHQPVYASEQAPDPGAYNEDDIPFSIAPFLLPWLGAAIALGGLFA